MNTPHGSGTPSSPCFSEASQADEASEDALLAPGDQPGRPYAASNAVPFSQRTPARSFYHRSFHGSLGCTPPLAKNKLHGLSSLSYQQIQRSIPRLGSANKRQSSPHGLCQTAILSLATTRPASLLTN